MNKQELVDAVAAKAGTSRASAARTLDTLLDIIRTTVTKGDSVELVGFGSFSTGARAARVGRNPATGAAHLQQLATLQSNKLGNLGCGAGKHRFANLPIASREKMKRPGVKRGFEAKLDELP